MEGALGSKIGPELNAIAGVAKAIEIKKAAE
jgi:hypothetical protein